MNYEVVSCSCFSRLLQRAMTKCLKTETFISLQFWCGSYVWTAVPVDYILSSHLSMASIMPTNSDQMTFCSLPLDQIFLAKLGWELNVICVGCSWTTLLIVTNTYRIFWDSSCRTINCCWVNYITWQRAAKQLKAAKAGSPLVWTPGSICLYCIL